MIRRRGPACGLVTAGALLLVLSGCAREPVHRSTLTSKVGERVVNATIDGSASISSQDDKADVHFSGRTLTVEKERVVLDGKELSKIPAAAVKVEIEVQRGSLSVRADGTVVVPPTAVR